ncbi:histone-arginine methyltransferase CARM1 isoform X3 [Esox lucius]|uniref:histone-arginine methyltransferase CARM1 isoform X3 n=1 Tax=Esox lucius TaxID=8010 RepID=UPI0014768C71|nr:histone-arginine methyltransferase CARM1 isoform X3 [Esox lucius]
MFLSNRKVDAVCRCLIQFLGVIKDHQDVSKNVTKDCFVELVRKIIVLGSAAAEGATPANMIIVMDGTEFSTGCHPAGKWFRNKLDGFQILQQLTHLQKLSTGLSTVGTMETTERSPELTCYSINLFLVNEDQIQGEIQLAKQRQHQSLSLQLNTGTEETELIIQDGDGVCVSKFTVTRDTDCCRVGSQSFLITVGCLSALLQFRTQSEFQVFNRQLRRDDDPEKKQQSVFDKRTEDSMALQYFQFYGCLSQQQNMLQDYLRTATYQKAILLNEADFKDKIVLDVGSGSGILSFFAIQAGAKRVYAVEASPVDTFAEMLVKSNRLSDRIIVLSGRIEEVSCPEEVDVIISEPIGYMLLNERMLEGYLHSRKWLKPKGMMFPTYSDMHLAPFNDEQLYIEHYARSNFWHQTCFYGVNLSGLHSSAVDEFFKQPIVDTFDMSILTAKSVKHCVNFMEAKAEDLQRLEIPFVFKLLQSGLIHGLAFWFDVAFVGSKMTVWLSTAPSEPLTHWYQVRCLFQTPLFGKVGQTLSGTVQFIANTRKSYDIHITAVVDQSGFKSGNSLDLKNPFFRYA